MEALKIISILSNKNNIIKEKTNIMACFIFINLMNFGIREIFLNQVYKANKFLEWYKLRNVPASVHELPAGKCNLKPHIVKFSLSIEPTLQSASIFHVTGEAAAFREPPSKFSALQYALYTLLLFVARTLSYSENKMTAAPHTVSTSSSVFLKRDSPHLLFPEGAHAALDYLPQNLQLF
jgi:hypothetical protein